MRVLTSSRADVLVVLPTLGDRLVSLERALESATAPAQAVSTRVVMVVPSGRKQAIALAQRFGAVVVDDPGTGMSAAINRGLSAHSGEDYYIWLGDDDYYLPDGLKTLKELLDTRGDCVVAYGGCDYVADSGEVVWTSRVGGLARFLLGFGPNLIPHPAAMIRRTALMQLGGYDEQLDLAMDLDVFLRLKKTGRFASTTKSVSAFGWHPGSLTVQDRRRSEREARIVKLRQLPQWARPIEPLWAKPVAWASRIAARRLDRRGKLS